MIDGSVGQNNSSSSSMRGIAGEETIVLSSGSITATDGAVAVLLASTNLDAIGCNWMQLDAVVQKLTLHKNFFRGSEIYAP